MDHLERLEDPSYFFKPIGSLRVGPYFDPKGYNRLLAVASHTGVLFWASGKSVFWAFTRDAVQAARSSCLDDGLKGCLQPQPAATVSIVSISPQEDELAVGCEDGSLTLFALARLFQIRKEGGIDYATSQIWRVGLESAPTALMWQVDQFSCLLENGKVHRGSVSTKTIEVYDDDTFITAFDANQSSTMCAFSSKTAPDVLVIRHENNRVSVKIEVEDEEDIAIESVHWRDDNSILTSCIVQVDGQEDTTAYIGLVTVNGDVLQEQGIKIYAVDIMTVQGPESSAIHGPYLHTCGVQDWGITVLAHSKSDDMHFRVLGCGCQASDQPVVLDMPFEGTITIPMTQDDEDNYVVGIGMDFTGDMVPVSWKVGDTVRQLQPCPILAVATTDGYLRFYSFGYIDQPFSLVHPAAHLPSATQPEEGIVDHDYESLPDAPMGSGAASEPLSPVLTENDAAEDNQASAQSQSSPQPFDVDDGSSLLAALTPGCEENFDSISATSPEGKDAAGMDALQELVGVDKRPIGAVATVSDPPTGTNDQFALAPKAMDSQLPPPAQSSHDQPYEDGRSDPDLYGNSFGLGFFPAHASKDVMNSDRTAASVLGGTGTTWSKNDSAGGILKSSESNKFISHGYLPIGMDSTTGQDDIIAASEQQKQTMAKDALAADSEVPASTVAASSPRQPQSADEDLDGSSEIQHEPNVEGEGRSNLSMNVNPIYDTSSLNSSPAGSAVQAQHPKSAALPQSLPQSIPRLPPGLKGVPKDPPGIVKKSSIPGPKLGLTAKNVPEILAPVLQSDANGCSVPDGHTGSAESTVKIFDEPRISIPVLDEAEKPLTRKQIAAIEDSILFGNPLTYHIDQLQTSRHKLVYQRKQMKEVDALVGKTKHATKRIAVLKQKIEELKYRKEHENPEDEVKMRVSRIEEAYRRVSSGLETLNLLQSFCRGNKQVKCSIATRHGQTAYYAVTETLQGIRIAANNLQARIRRVESLKEESMLLPKRLSREGFVAAQSVQIRTPWSSMTQDECRAISDKIKKRNPVLAYAPGLAPESPSPAIKPQMTCPQVDEEPPPLPPTRINTPVVQVGERPDVLQDISKDKLHVEHKGTDLSGPGKSKLMGKPPIVTTAVKPASSTPSSCAPFETSGQNTASVQCLGASFGSPTSLAEAVKEGMQDGKVPSERQSGGFPSAALSQGQTAQSSTFRTSLFSLDSTTTSILGSPAMSGEKSSFSQPHETGAVGTFFSGSSRAEPFTDRTLVSGARDPSPFASGLPEDAQDLGEISTELNFAGLGFGQSNKDPRGLSLAGKTLAFGAVSAPSPPVVEKMQETASVAAFSNFPSLGDASGGKGLGNQTSGGIFGGFGQQGAPQESLFGPSTHPGPGLETSQPQESSLYQGISHFAQNQAVALSGGGLGGGFGAPAVLGAGGVADQLGSLHAPPAGGYANHAGGGNAFANLVPQNVPSFGNQPTVPIFAGSSQKPGFGSTVQNNTNLPSTGSVFGRIGLGGQQNAGIGGAGGASPQSGSLFQPGKQDNSLWKPRR